MSSQPGIPVACCDRGNEFVVAIPAMDQPSTRVPVSVIVPIKNEADNGLKNLRGTIAMARTQVPDSATAQFFINSVDNDFLNHQNKTLQGWGYTVFGKVVEGMDVVDAITKVKTGNRGGHQDVPVDTLMIIKAERVK